MFGELIGSAIGGFAQAGASVYNTYKSNQSNEYINEQNLQFQRENLDYQKALQQKIFEREDSSYQRTVNDMRKAGLSPLMMNGTNGAGEAIATSPLDAGRPNSYSFQLPDFVNLAQQFEMNKEQIRRQKLENDMSEDSYDLALFEKRYDLLEKYYSTLDKQRREEFNRQFGFHSGMSPEERKMIFFLRAFGYGNEEGLNPPPLTAPLISKHGKYDEYLNDLWSRSGTTNYSVNPDTFAKAFSGKELLTTGLDYASQFLKFFNIFNRSKKSKDNNPYDDILKDLPF